MKSGNSDSLLRQDDLVVADFSTAQFVDSSILGVVLDTHARACERGKVFRLQLGTSAIVHREAEPTLSQASELLEGVESQFRPNS